MHAKLILKRREDKRLRSGHLWIFSNEVDGINGSAENGDLIDVFDSSETLVGTGFYNKNSLIAVRMLNNNQVEELYPLFREKILNAYELRKTFYPGLSSFRMIFSESDYLPGLIIDKYNNTFVLQVYSFGMQKNISIIVKILHEEFGAENIFTKHEPYFRKMEGLPEEDEIYLGERKSEIISDGSLSFNINFETGQKTGFFFDQRDNRFFIEKFVKDKTVIDAFCNSGGFGMHAAKAGAASVSFVDSSASEIENTKKNIELNNLNGNFSFYEEDVFDFLSNEINEQKKYDVVMVDPPAFAKSKKQIAIATKGYEKLNKRALQIVAKNGYLVTSSCSHFIGRSAFTEILIDASRKAEVNIQQVHFASAALDHPQLTAMPETTYLKFAVFRVN